MPTALNTLTEGLTETLKAYGQKVTVQLKGDLHFARPLSTHAVVVLGAPVTASHISRIGKHWPTTVPTLTPSVVLPTIQ